MNQEVSHASADEVSGSSEIAVSEYARLLYEKSDGRVIEKNVLRTTTLVGAHPSCNLQLLSSQVSDCHCVLTLDGRGFRLWDLRSHSGTHVNNQQVRSCRLKDGDLVRVGSFEFRFETNIEDDSRRGFFIDDYRVLGILGTGGMGWLYMVEDPRTRQRYALKVLMRRSNHPHVAQEELRTRFLLEGRAGLKLKHRNIVEIIDYQHRSDVEYLLLELFESISLQELIHRDGALPPGLVCSVARQAALALHHIHHEGSVHRDVKPSNILVDQDGLTKICDFGLVFLGADPIEQELAAQMGGDCLGTADYISPEQSYNSYRIDGRADLYSLGCSMYVALTGQLPFPQERGRDKIAAHRHSQPVPMRQLNPAIPEEVAQIVERCLRKDPNERFADGQELAAVLEPFATNTQVEFQFAKLLAQRTHQASLRLSDPKKRHYLQRIPANVATSLHVATGSNERFESEHVVIDSRPRSEIGTHLPGDTSSATEPR
ncbi:FHA domain-containing serine/threonine-protein kinase [Rubinisphaera sp. JC750]|uniref:FHA domain-containing serine/threonine-protein kinase n=1 Tax=Rubinisphaera sp. JC750 TaxID=2898658 RepID=UPI001F1A1044|nr:FHA domain-containing serine/threonine-protein kinase [Rubinisphaera sp. JC750]